MRIAGYNMTNMSGKRGVNLGERGMVSFLVTLIMLAVITLIVVGFTQVANRNSREALDRQLSAQAFYAAESGVNVTRDIIQTALDGGATDLATKKTCANDYNPAVTGGVGLPINDLGGASSGVRYTCVIVDPHPSSLVYTDITTDNSVVIPVEAATDFASLSFNWTKKSGAPTGTCTGQAQNYYPASATWACGFGILRLDVMQVTDPTAPPNSATAMYDATNTLFLSPYGAHSGSLTGSLNFGAGGIKGFYGTGCEPNPLTGACAAGNKPCDSACTVNVTVSGARKYYVRATMLYENAGQLTVRGKTASGDFAPLLNAQTMVDVTGKAQDELRRIQVRLATDNTLPGGNDGLPLNSLVGTQGICKRFTIAPGESAATSIDPTPICGL
jgi:Tfp pilus assembly protein PilX